MNIKLLYCDTQGKVYDDPRKYAAMRTGNRIVPADMGELIGLPFGGELFSLPDRIPAYYKADKTNIAFTKQISGDTAWAASAFLPSGYLRTYLPAYKASAKSPRMSLWAYAAVAMIGDDFYAAGMRIDDDERSDPAIHCNDDELKIAVKKLKDEYPQNRLVKQLSKCAQQYRCLCARNFFLSRYEAPIPTSTACNARCLGCLSHQNAESGFGESQHRIKFAPTADEIAQTITHHFKRVDRAIASFGQGCEGEPLLRAKDLARAIAIVRSKTEKGTINLNTNGSLPEHAEQMIAAGLDSIRVSLNSPTEKYYNAYFRPQGYTYQDVLQTIRAALDKGIFVSINLFFLPGFTDMQSEIDSLYKFLEKYPVNMIQTRNLNIDPDFYFNEIKYKESDILGIRKLIEMLKRDFLRLRIGYYNPAKETFAPPKSPSEAP